MADKLNEQSRGLQADDLTLVSKILQLHPEVEEVIRAVRQVSAGAKYPIQSFDELAQALGGDQGTVTFRGQQMRVGDIRRLIPAYYFPIGSEQDLIAKVSDLQSRAGGGQQQPGDVNKAPNLKIEWAQARGDKPEGTMKPNISIEEIQAHAKARGLGNAPGLGGMEK
jgi:hypothetical protein